MENNPKIEQEVSRKRSIEEIIDNLIAKKEECEDCSRFEILEQTPPKMRKKLEERIDMLEEAGVKDEEVLNRATEFFAQEVKTSYMDSRFEIPNQTYLRMELVNRVDQLLENNELIESLSKLGVLFFDINGLKAVNDINGHDAGDKYLETVVNVLENGKTSKILNKRGIDTFVTSNGGDEFSVILDSKFELKKGSGEALIEKILKKYQEEIKNSDCSELIDFKDDEVRKKFNDLSIEIPDNFEFSATASGGWSLLEEALDRVEEFDVENYHEILNNITGGMLDISDQRSIQNKEKMKKDLKNGSEEERFLHKVLQRNESAMRAEKRIEELEKEIAQLKERLSNKD